MKKYASIRKMILGAALSLSLVSATEIVGFAATVPTNDNVTSSMVKINARPDFQFRTNLDNKGDGEASPIHEAYYLSAYKVTNAQYYEFVKETNRKVNQALCGAALSLGANIEIRDIPGYAPLINDKGMIPVTCVL